MHARIKYSYPSPLDEICHHDNRLDLLLPDHPPECREAGRERGLRRDVRVRPLHPVHIVGVDVAVALARLGRLLERAFQVVESDASVLVWKM